MPITNKLLQPEPVIFQNLDISQVVPYFAANIIFSPITDYSHRVLETVEKYISSCPSL